MKNALGYGSVYSLWVIAALKSVKNEVLPLVATVGLNATKDATFLLEYSVSEPQIIRYSSSSCVYL